MFYVFIMFLTLTTASAQGFEDDVDDETLPVSINGHAALAFVSAAALGLYFLSGKRKF